MKQKTGRKLLGVLLTVALLLGLAPWLGQTARAEYITPISAMVNTTTVVKFNNMDWYVIGYEPGDNGTITLLSKDCIGRSVFNTADNDNYEGSEVWKYLDNYYKTNFANNSSVVVENNGLGYLYLLSMEEAQAINNENRGILITSYKTSSFESTWWLRTTRHDGINVNYAGTVLYSYLDENIYIECDSDVTALDYAVRPALKLNANKVALDSTNTFKLKQALTGMTLDETNVTVGTGATHRLGATFTPADTATQAVDRTVTWSSDHPEIATVNANGVVTGVAEGTATITATATNGTAGTSDDKTATCTVKVVKTYPVWVGGVQVTNENLSGTGWSYNAESNALTLNGYSYSGTGYNNSAIYTKGDLNIVLTGENTVAITNSTGYGIYVQGNLTIGGEGSLNASGPNFGLFTNGGNIAINDGTVTATAEKEAAIRSNCGGVLINGGTVTATEPHRGISASNSVQISGGTVVATGTDSSGWGIDCPDGSFMVTGGEFTTSGGSSAINGNPSMTIGEGLDVFAGENEASSSDVTATFASSHAQKWVHIAPHAHRFTYAAGTGENANTLTAICVSGCPDGYDEHPVALTISAEDAVYNGSAYTGVTLDTTAWTAAGLTAPTIQYAGLEGTTYELNATAPTNAGGYTASVTVEGATASVEFTISRADIDPSVTLEGWAYGENASTPSVDGNPGNGEVTYTYAEKDGTEYSETVPTEVGDYTVKASVTETTNYNGGEATAEFTIAKADIEPSVTLEGWTYGEEANAPSVDAETNPGNGEVTYTYAEKGSTEYSKTVPTEAGEYTVKATVAETDNYNAGEATADFAIAKADIEPSVTLEGWTYGEEANAPSVDGNPGEGEVTYTYAEKDGTEYSETVPAEAGDYTVKATVAETDNYKGGEAEADFTIAKADAVPAAISANHRIYDGTENPLVTVTGEAEGGEMQYALGTATEVTGEYGAAIPTATDAGTYYVWYRVVGDDNHESTDALGPVEVNLDPEHEFGEPDFILPEQLKVLDESAFEGVTSLTIVDAHNCTSIGKDAFKGTGLKQIRLPKDCEIDPEAFGEQRICVFAPAGGTTEAFCADYDNLVFIAEAE